MKKLLCLLFVCTASIAHAASPKNVLTEEAHDELTRIDLLIEATNANLERLKNLRALLSDYKKTETIALENPDDTDNLLKLVMLAKEIQNTIHDMALQDYFAQQFMEELKQFAQIAEQKHIPQAR